MALARLQPFSSHLVVRVPFSLSGATPTLAVSMARMDISGRLRGKSAVVMAKTIILGVHLPEGHEQVEEAVIVVVAPTGVPMLTGVGNQVAAGDPGERSIAVVLVEEIPPLKIADEQIQVTIVISQSVGRDPLAVCLARVRNWGNQGFPVQVQDFGGGRDAVVLLTGGV